MLEDFLEENQFKDIEEEMEFHLATKDRDFFLSKRNRFLHKIKYYWLPFLKE